MTTRKKGVFLTMQKRKGSLLTDIAVGVGLLAVLAGIVAGIYYGLSDSVNFVAATESSINLATAAMTCMKRVGNFNFDDLSIETMRDRGCLPAGFDGVNANPFGGDFIVQGDPGDGSRYQVQMTNVGEQPGEELVQYFASRAEDATYNSGSRTFTVTFR